MLALVESSTASSGRTSPRRWNQRTTAVVGLMLSGLAVPVTGLLDHAAGREWALVHAAPGVLFVVLCVWHALLNRRGVLRHLSRRIPAGWGLPSREALASAVVTAVVVGGTVVHALEV